MPKVQRQQFLKGINQSVPIEQGVDTSRLYTLQNARLFKRGEVGNVARISGYESIVTDANYANVLDMAFFKNRLFILYSDGSTNFYIDIVDTSSDTVDNTLTYTGDSTSTGELLKHENSLFISPHNKFIYDDNGTWRLIDFISEVPNITSISPTVNSTNATGTVEVTSTLSGFGGSKAKYILRFITNEVPVGETQNHTITIDGNQSDPFAVGGGDSLEDIANAAKTAIEANTSITTDWNITVIDPSRPRLADGLFPTPTNSALKIEAVNVGKAWNNKDITWSMSSKYYNVTEGLPTESFPDFNFGDPSAQTPLVKVAVVNGNQRTKGGIDSGTDYGRLSISFSRTRKTFPPIPFSSSAITEKITTVDTTDDIASKVKTALEAEQWFNDDYTITLDPDSNGNNSKMKIDAINKGTSYNASITFIFKDISLEPQIFTLSEDDSTGPVFNISAGTIGNGSLENFTDYWYKVRYKYLDGHVTRTSFPVWINTGADNTVEVSISATDTDLDGNRPKIQVFRKKEGEDFYLIDEISSSEGLTYIDSGQLKQNKLEESFYIWTNRFETQDIVENRLVKANVEYADRSITSSSEFSLGKLSTSGDKILPKNSIVEVFSKPKFSDGTYGAHRSIGQITVNNEEAILDVNQTSTVTSEKDVDEIGFYIKSRPKKTEYSYLFNSGAIENRNIQTLNSRGGESSDIFPNKTRILFGWRYIFRLGDAQTDGAHFIYDQGLSRSSSNSTENVELHRFPFDISSQGSAATGELPDTLTFSIFGVKFKYIKRAFSSVVPQGIYELANVNALKEAASTGLLQLRLVNAPENISSQSSLDELTNVNVKVTGVIDEAEGQPFVSVHSDNDDHATSVVYPPLRSKLYLQLEDSVLDTIDDETLNRYDLIKDYSDLNNGFEGSGSAFLTSLQNTPNKLLDIISSKLSFELINFEKLTDASKVSYTGAGANFAGGQPIDVPEGEDSPDYYLYTWNQEDYYLHNFDYSRNNDAVIFLGSKTNTVDSDSFSNTGFTLEKTNNLTYVKLDEHNIYETKINLDDIKQVFHDYPNQIIWSDPIVRDSSISGIRNFGIESLFSIPSNNGDIIKIESLLGHLVVFCEKGVAVLPIGEVLTEQKNGSVYIDSSTFISGYKWIAENLTDIRKNSIAKINNILFYSDGYNVYSFDGQTNNIISNGHIDLHDAHDHVHSDTDLVGVIDLENSEYILTDTATGNSYGYNYNIGEWNGPYQYKNINATRDQVEYFGIIGTDLVRHNTGNTFAGTEYETIIESIANDLDALFFDKTWRKFFVSVENYDNASFQYSQDRTEWVNRALTYAKQINGLHRIGIKSPQQNNRSLYWRVKSKDDGFLLNGISYQVNVKNR